LLARSVLVLREVALVLTLLVGAGKALDALHHE
jgi:hypothetical protein